MIMIVLLPRTRLRGSVSAERRKPNLYRKAVCAHLAAYDIIWEEALHELKDVVPDFQYKTFIVSRNPFFEDHGTYYFEVSSPMEQKLMQNKFAATVQSALENATQSISGQPQTLSVVYMTPPEAETFRGSFSARRDTAVSDTPTANASETKPNDEIPERSGDAVENADAFSSGSSKVPAQPKKSSPHPNPRTPAETGARAEIQQLNPAHTFDSFVVGESNSFANAAARAVANAPGRVYNPLFLYGDVGLGKTHLMHAIGNEILLAHPETRIVYVTTETFTNELIYMIQSGTSVDRRQEFRNKYRRADVLMIDDIQFLAGKDTTQEEFFHTFNELHSDRKQIVISSDRPPTEVTPLEERMRSRFEWGLVAKIEKPDYETRVAILMKKAEERPDMLPIDEDVFHYIAEQPNANIRSLEGALTHLTMYASLHQSKRIDMLTAKNALQSIFSAKIDRVITAGEVCSAVCEEYGVTEEDIKGPRRTKNVAFARHVAMYVLRKMTDMSLAQVAGYFGKKDHTTVMHAERVVTKAMQENANVKQPVDDIMDRLRNR